MAPCTFACCRFRTQVAYDQLWSNTVSIPDLVRLGVLCVIYFATAKFGLSLDAVSGFAAAVWPPTGIALVALVLFV